MSVLTDCVALGEEARFLYFYGKQQYPGDPHAFLGFALTVALGHTVDPPKKIKENWHRVF